MKYDISDVESRGIIAAGDTAGTGSPNIHSIIQTFHCSTWYHDLSIPTLFTIMPAMTNIVGMFAIRRTWDDVQLSNGSQF